MDYDDFTLQSFATSFAKSTQGANGTSMHIHYMVLGESSGGDSALLHN